MNATVISTLRRLYADLDFAWRAGMDFDLSDDPAYLSLWPRLAALHKAAADTVAEYHEDQLESTLERLREISVRAEEERARVTGMITYASIA